MELVHHHRTNNSNLDRKAEVVETKHKVEVVRITHLEPHPRADNLEVTKIWGYVSCVQKGQFKIGDLAAYIEPDSIVDTSRPEFSFLGDHSRIRVRTMRGMRSQGFVLPAPPGSKEGDDVAEILGVTHYDPPIPMSTGGECEKPPPGFYPSYDIKPWRHYKYLLNPEEMIVATEKIHGASSRYCFRDGKFYVSSHNEWKRYCPKNMFWQAAIQNPWIEEFCRNNPELTLYGEVFGTVKHFKYGSKQNQIQFAAFDVLYKGDWMSYEDTRTLDIKHPVPVVYYGPYNEDRMLELCSGPSIVAMRNGADHIREGIVIKPIKERISLEIGRVQLKLVSDDYYEHKKG